LQMQARDPTHLRCCLMEDPRRQWYKFQIQQYLMATFALFSFFNSPLTSSPQNLSHGLGTWPLPDSDSFDYHTTNNWIWMEGNDTSISPSCLSARLPLYRYALAPQTVETHTTCYFTHRPRFLAPSARSTRAPNDRLVLKQPPIRGAPDEAECLRAALESEYAGVWVDTVCISHWEVQQRERGVKLIRRCG
jgi:hypothetical protein